MGDMRYSVSLAERTADMMLEKIMDSGWYEAGKRLPSENELAIKYGVSRSTLREAIKILAARGVLEIRRGTGTFIAAIPQDKSVALPDLRKMRLELRDLYEVRLIFEPRAAAIACERATDEEIDRIEALARQIERLGAEGEDTTDADIGFHTSIIRATHNEFIYLMEPLIQQAMSDRRFLAAEGERDTAYTPDHIIITDFLRKRDKMGAQAAVLVHLRRMTGALGMSTDFQL